jgi:hypothetical protein
VEALLTNKELRAVKDLIAFIVMAVKNYDLYPVYHDLFKKMVTDLCKRFEAVLNRYGSLKLEIERDRIFYKDEIVFQESTEDGNLAFILFRDGIRCIEFGKTLKRDEISYFINTLKSYSAVNEDPEGDLVTALWEADFENIRYKAVDIYWDSEPLTDLKKFAVNDPKLIDKYFDESTTDDSLLPSAPNSEKNGLFKLNDSDIDHLRKMIIEEERKEIVKDIFSLISAFIKDPNSTHEIGSLLLLIKIELRKILFQGNLKLAFLILEGIYRLKHYSEKVNSQAISIVDQYIKSISKPSFLEGLHKLFTVLYESDPEQVRFLKKFFQLLHPTALLSIAPNLPQIKSIRIQKQLIEIMCILSTKDSKPLERLLNDSDEPTILKLLHVVNGLPRDKSQNILLKMLDNESETIRVRALQHLIYKKSVPTDILFRFLDNPDLNVSQLILDYLEQNKCEDSEEQLCQYLKNRWKSRSDPNHIIDCYKTLGRCGSDQSIPFLKNALFKNRVLPNFRTSIHQKGAVIALSEINVKEADKILEKASRSFFPKIRIAYKKGMAAANC